MRGGAKEGRSMRPEMRTRSLGLIASVMLTAALATLCPVAAQAAGATADLPNAIKRVQAEEGRKTLERVGTVPAPAGWGRTDPQWDHALPPAPPRSATVAQCDQYRAKLDEAVGRADRARMRCEQGAGDALATGKSVWMPNCRGYASALCAADYDRLCFFVAARDEGVPQCQGAVDASGRTAQGGMPAEPQSGSSPLSARTPAPAPAADAGWGSGRLAPDWREQARTGLAGAIRDFDRTMGPASAAGRGGAAGRHAGPSGGSSPSAGGANDPDTDDDAAGQAASRAAMLDAIERMNALQRQLQNQRQTGAGGGYGGAGRQAPTPAPSMRPPPRCGPGGCEVKG